MKPDGADPPAPGRPGPWGDLRPRVASGLLLVAVGAFAIFMGGTWFLVPVAVATGLMIWELTRMLAPEFSARGVLHGAAAAALIVATPHVGAAWTAPLCAALAVVATLTMPRKSLVYGAFFAAMLIADYGLVTFREDHGMVWLYWLVVVVAATDIFGYFGGRVIGGPKFWPSVSPKKTWAGILCGWAAAAAVGAAFSAFTFAGWELIWISALLSFASQLGDIAESALKRRVGVKDSSNLIPGHGGLLDRFDGLLGAALFMVALALFIEPPAVRL